jgi:hypothetical protein
VKMVEPNHNLCPCHARDWKIFFDPTARKTGTFPGLGAHILLIQKSLKRPNGAHFEPQVQRPDNTALRRGLSLSRSCRITT